MARARRPARATSNEKKERPAPLPPETRTVGQLVAESIRFFGDHFFSLLPIGLVVAVANQIALDTSRIVSALVLLAFSPLFTLAYAYASMRVTGSTPSRRGWGVALLAGTLAFGPAALTLTWFTLVSVLWLALVGLVVPVAIAEEPGFVASFERAYRLGRADFVHAAGGIAALVLLFVLVRLALALLLESQAENTVRVAIFLADLALSPMVFIGSAIVYVDQAARLAVKRGAAL
jgi:hypothetical protein